MCTAFVIWAESRCHGDGSISASETMVIFMEDALIRLNSKSIQKLIYWYKLK
jgi:hypothetical protein